MFIRCCGTWSCCQGVVDDDEEVTSPATMSRTVTIHLQQFSKYSARGKTGGLYAAAVTKCVG